MDTDNYKRGSAPNSKRRQNLSPKNAPTFCSPEFGMATKRPAVYIKTLGWPMVTVARDGAGGFKEDKRLGMNGLGYADHNFRN